MNYSSSLINCLASGCGVDCEPGYIRRSRVLTVPCSACQAREAGEKQRIILGDCLDVLRQMENNSVDAVVTDPPYGLGNREPTAEEIVEYIRGADLDHQGDFMGKDWQIPSVEIWRECLRVLKPGGYLLSFGGSRTWDLISLGIRAAGFEKCEDVASMSAGLAWVFGSGFPKSMNLSKAIDAAAGAEREVVGDNPNARPNSQADYSLDGESSNFRANYGPITTSATSFASSYDGVGTSLKPAFEPILVFQKPVEPVTSEEIHRITGWDHWCSDKRIYEHSKRKRLTFAELLAAGYEPIAPSGNAAPDVESEAFEEPDVEPQPPGKPYFVLRTRRALHPDAEDQLVLRHAVGEAVLERGPYKPWKIKGYVGNVLKYGTGGLNIDACRVAGQPSVGGAYSGGTRAPITGDDRSTVAAGMYGEGGRLVPEQFQQPPRRWPANVVFSHLETCCPVGTILVPANGAIGEDTAAATSSRATARRSVYAPHDADRGEWKPYGNGDGTETVEKWECEPGCVVAELDQQSIVGGIHSAGKARRADEGSHSGVRVEGWGNMGAPAPRFGDHGGASRFFYCMKASRSEREAGCEHLPARSGAANVGREEGSAGANSPRAGSGRTAKEVRNHHVTVKPLKLMRWLVRMVCPPGGLLLDPFAGSGTALCAAALEGVKAIGIEREVDYVEIAKARLAHWQKQAP